MLSSEFIEQLVDKSVQEVCALEDFKGLGEAETKERFVNWIEQLSNHSGCAVVVAVGQPDLGGWRDFCAIDLRVVDLRLS